MGWNSNLEAVSFLSVASFFLSRKKFNKKFFYTFKKEEIKNPSKEDIFF